MTPRTRSAGATLLTGLFLALGSAPAAADMVALPDGRRVKAVKETYDPAARTVTLRLEDGTRSTFAMDALCTRSVFQAARGVTSKEDAAGNLKVADFARDIGLFAHAERHYRRAGKADPALAPVVEQRLAMLDARVASTLLERARAALARGDVDAAERELQRVVAEHPNAPQAVEAAQVLGRLCLAQSAPFATVAAPAGARASEGVEPALDEVRVTLARMVEHTLEGLTDDRAGTRAVRAWESGLSLGDDALATLDRLAREPGGAARQSTSAELRAAIDAQRVELRLHLASHWTVRGSFPRALEHARQALVIAPDDERALAALARIEDGANRGLPWLWLR